MANVIQIKRHSTYSTDASPGANTLAYGELAWNNQGSKLFIGQRTSGSAVGSYHLNAPITIGTTAFVPGTTSTSLSGLTVLDGVSGSDLTIGASLGTTDALSIGSSACTVTIPGSLTVQGALTSVATTNLEITDKAVQLGKGASTQTLLDGIGIYGDPTTGTDVEFLIAGNGTKWNSNIPITATGFTGPLTGNASSATTSAALTGTQAAAINLNTAKVTQRTTAQVRSQISASGNSQYDSSTGVITSTNTNTTYPTITATAGGVMANGDAVKFAGIATGAQVNTAHRAAGTGMTLVGNTLNCDITQTTNTDTQLTDTYVRNLFDGGTNIAINAAGVISGTDTNTQRAAGTGLTLSGNTLNCDITQTSNNVTTNLGVSRSGTAFTVTSSDGNNASLPLADTTNWGLMSDEMFDTLAATLSTSDTINGGTVAWA